MVDERLVGLARSVRTLAVVAAAGALVACGGGGDGDDDKGATPAGDSSGGTTAQAPSLGEPSDVTQPPNKARVDADIRAANGEANDIVSIEFAQPNGKKTWSSAHSQYFYEWPVVVRRKAHLDGAPDAVVQIGGFARYEITGDQYHYREFKVTWNEYENMPNAGEADLRKVVFADFTPMFRGKLGAIGSDTLEISMPEGDEAREWEWHTANSVSVNFNVAYDEAVNATEMAHWEGTMRLRFYRDAPDQAWKNYLVTSHADMKQTGTKTFTEEELLAVPSLADTPPGG